MKLTSGASKVSRQKRALKLVQARIKYWKSQVAIDPSKMTYKKEKDNCTVAIKLKRALAEEASLELKLNPMLNLVQ